MSPPEFGIPGFHGTATESLLEFSSAKLQELAQRGFDRISFPNVLSSWDIPVIGTVTLNLSSVLLSSLPHSSRITRIDTNAQGGIEYLIQLLTADVTCQFSLYRGIFPALRGNADLHFKDSTILYSFIPRVDSNGNLVFVSQGPAYVSIPAVGVQTSQTPLAWLYNLLLNKFGSQINRIAAAEISRQISEVLPNAVNKFLAVDILQSLGGLAFNIAFAGDPYVQLNRITVVNWAQPRAWPAQVPYDCSCLRTDTWQPPTWEGIKPPMFIADIDEVAINCVLWAYNIYNALQQQFRSADLQMTLQTNFGQRAYPICR